MVYLNLCLTIGQDLGTIPDTGADICAAPYKALTKWPSLTKSSIFPKTASDQKVAGYCDVKLSLGAFCYQTRLYRIDELNAPILSREACRQLRIIPDNFPEQLEHTHTLSLKRPIFTCQGHWCSPYITDFASAVR